MVLSATEATLLSRIVVHQHSRDLTLVSVVITAGDRSRAAVTVTISGCHKEPCAFTATITQPTGVAFHREFTEQLSEALEKHVSSWLPARVASKELSADWR
jgi:hypothetical protein